MNQRRRERERRAPGYDHQAPLAPRLKAFLTPLDDAAREISRAVRLRGARSSRARALRRCARGPSRSPRRSRPPASRGARRGRAQGDDRRRHRHRAPAARHEGRRQRRGHSAVEDPPAADQARDVGAARLGARARPRRAFTGGTRSPSDRCAPSASASPARAARSPSSRARRRSPGARARRARRVIFPERRGRGCRQGHRLHDPLGPATHRLHADDERLVRPRHRRDQRTVPPDPIGQDQARRGARP